MALKDVSKDYEQFMEKRGQQPLLYRQFRQDFQKILQTSPLIFKKLSKLASGKNLKKMRHLKNFYDKNFKWFQLFEQNSY